MATDAPNEPAFAASQNAVAPEDMETLSPLEQEVLDEYARLLENMNTVSHTLFCSSHKQSLHTLSCLELPYFHSRSRLSRALV